MAASSSESKSRVALEPQMLAKRKALLSRGPNELEFPLEMHGYSVEFSPFPYEGVSRIAVGASQHYGMVGNGRVLVVDHVHASPQKPFNVVATFDTLNSVFDCCWYVLASSKKKKKKKN
jgi:hypothetical protein